jgi:hypothetical protein
VHGDWRPSGRLSSPLGLKTSTRPLSVKTLGIWVGNLSMDEGRSPSPVSSPQEPTPIDPEAELIGPLDQPDPGAADTGQRTGEEAARRNREADPPA